jgi:hypothetical protein
MRKLIGRNQGKVVVLATTLTIPASRERNDISYLCLHWLKRRRLGIGADDGCLFIAHAGHLCFGDLRIAQN